MRGAEVVEDDRARIIRLDLPRPALQLKHHRTERHCRGVPRLRIKLRPRSRRRSACRRDFEHYLPGPGIVTYTPERVIRRIVRKGQQRLLYATQFALHDQTA